MRIYDPRTGRFYSVDPLKAKYPELSTYQFASNNPIKFIDLDGLEGADPITTVNNWFGGFWSGEGKAYKAIEFVNDNFNPLYILNKKGYELRTGKDFYTKENKSRASTVAETGVETVMMLTGSKLFKALSRAETPLLKQMAQNEMAMGKPKTPPVQEKVGGTGGNRDINPTKGDMNCANCAVAGDLTLKGTPATATNILQNPLEGVTGRDFFGMWGSDLSVISEHANPKSIISTMSKLKDGATGVIYGLRADGQTGHFFNVAKQNGVVTFFDFQLPGSASKLNPTTLMKDYNFSELLFRNTTDITPSALLPKK